MLVVCCLCVARCWLGVCCSLFVQCGVLVFVVLVLDYRRCLLFVVCSLLFCAVICCLWFVGIVMLIVLCCMLSVVC